MSSLGDVVNALPTAHALRRAFPEAFIGWVVDEPLAPLLRRSDLVDEVFPLPIPNGQTVRWDDALRAGALLAELSAFVRRLHARHFDAVLELQGLLRSAVAAHLSGARDRVGFVDERRECNYLFLNRRVAPNGRHAVDRFLTLAEAVGAPRGTPSWGSLTAPDEGLAVERLVESLPAGRPLVALNPGASASYKRWPARRYAEAAEAISRRVDAAFVALGAPSERGLCQEVCNRAATPVLNLGGCTTLPQLAALLKRCACVVTGDTGPMHLSVAVGTTVVALMGPTDPSITGPYGADHVVLQAEGAQPAEWGQSRCRDPELLLQIGPRDAAEAVCSVLERSSG